MELIAKTYATPIHNKGLTKYTNSQPPYKHTSDLDSIIITF